MMHYIQTTTRWIVVTIVGIFLAVAHPLRADVLINGTAFTVGATVGNNTVVTNWIGSPFAVTAPVFIYQTGNNSVTISNFFITSTSASYLGFGTSNNVLTLLTNTTWNLNNQFLNVGSLTGAGSAAGNSLIVAGGMVSNLRLAIGPRGPSLSNQVIVQNGGILANVIDLNIGSATGANFNSLIVTNGGRYIQTAGDFLIGGGFNAAVGGGNNTVILSNSLVTITGSSGNKNIGSGSSNNTVTLLGNTVWNQGGTPLIIGGINNAGVGNILTLNGSIFSNVTALTVGNGPAAVNSANALIITNAGTLSMTSLTIGQNGSSSNLFKIDGGASSGAFVTNSGALTVGNGSYNLVTIRNGTFVNLGLFSLGGSANSISNQAILDAGGVLTNVNGLTVGNGAGANFNSLIVTSGGSFFMRSGAVNVGFSGNASGNTVLLSNSFLTSSGAATLGNGGSSNTLTLYANTVWNNALQGLTIGNGTSVSNVLTVNGGTLANVGALAIGAAAGVRSNQLVVINGGVVSNVTDLRIGHVAGAGFNSLIVTNGGRYIQTGGGFLVGAAFSPAASGGGNNTVILSNSVLTLATIRTGGDAIGVGSSNNTVTLLAHTLWNPNNTALTIGSGAAINNSLTVNGGVLTNVSTVTVGTATDASGNFLLITNGGQVFANTTVQAGGAGNSGNRVLVTDDGLLQVNSLVIGATGNTISNRNATYQFTVASPTITPLGAGNIAITDGTISFRGIATADVTNNLGNGALRGITFAGANTFMLNAASNTTAGQTYTFDTGQPNGPSNYVNLALINGHTAYRGGNLTIGAAGSMLVSNTTATISGLVTNTGTLSIVNAQATFQNRVYNSGTSTIMNSTATFNGGAINAGHWLTDPTTNIFGNFGLTNTASGAINMAAGDVYIFGNTVSGTPADFINVSTNKTAYNTTAGKFLFSGGLGLTQTFAVAGQNFGPAAVNAVGTATNQGTMIAGFVDNFALGTLELSNFSTVRVTDAFLDLPMAGLYLENLFLGENSLLIIEEGVQVYFKNSNAWSLTNIRLMNNQGIGDDVYNYNNSISGLHQIVVIPEPSVVVLCLAGGVTIWLSRRRHARQR